MLGQVQICPVLWGALMLIWFMILVYCIILMVFVFFFILLIFYENAGPIWVVYAIGILERDDDNAVDGDDDDGNGDKRIYNIC